MAKRRQSHRSREIDALIAEARAGTIKLPSLVASLPLSSFDDWGFPIKQIHKDSPNGTD